VNHTLRLAGFATRAIGLAIDGAIASLLAGVIAAGVAFALSLFGVNHVDQTVTAVLTTGGWIVLVVVYFFTFWALTGQTPGSRFMGIRVIDKDGGSLRRMQSLRRVGGMFLAAIPLGAGFLWVLVDDRRRGWQDLIGGTLVVHIVDISIEAAAEAALLAAGTAEPSAAPLESPGLPRLG
jgi:uncharacterized RDD family membrane protein YckC